MQTNLRFKTKGKTSFSAQNDPKITHFRTENDNNFQIYAYVGEGNRKDVRNAVEAAHKAAPGWGKRAAHNRAQIVYYMAENLELRRSEIAQRLSDITGKLQSNSLDMQPIFRSTIE